MIEVVMPQMGESLTEGTVVRWLKQPGDALRRDEPLFEISTDKVDSEVPAPADGRLARILVAVGERVAVGTPVALLDDGSAAVDAPPLATTPPAAAGSTGAAEGHFRQARPPQVVSFHKPRPDSPGATPEQAARSWSPSVLALSQQAGVPLGTLTSLTGSGRGGRITKRDVERFLERDGAAPAAAPQPLDDVAPAEFLYRPQDGDRIVPMSPVRRAIARHMSWSVRISPHSTAFAECDMSRITARIANEAERFNANEAERFKNEAAAPLTITVLAAHAAAGALREFPSLNASVVEDALVIKPRVHLGIAVALADTEELIVPVIRGADELSLPGLARAIQDLALRARARRLKPEDVQGGSFTLTNPGVFGGITGTPILSQPQVAILGLGAVTKRAVVVDDAIAIRPMMTLSLTFDHRAADGMVAFRYLARLRRELEGA